ncbi:hypothetical protein EDC30_10935 [Paucimonas lemoignei]|uniref:SH3b domain-containing protein n=1 Tax=Paucimonas lemoignei TaxID=29443 RepID=A0A4R3HRJ0_PAULE|nr:SH3 domain-containing protein [Paucimonas lemoignei]TCS35736.1 hypothetical protein EDC30_10935 [Paucimonas lemoignei]
MRTLAFAAIAFIAALLPFESHAAANPTPDYWKCVNRVSGSWTFGRAPYACDANSFGDDKFITTNMKALVFNDKSEVNGERARYMSDMYPAMRDIALYYLNSRKPSASAEEKNAWLRAMLALAHQESYWSHYRSATDGRLKMMRGDSGHGHGIMQVDDRWHFVAVKAGKGWNLVENMLYGMEEFYGNWQRAASASCVRYATDWRSRSRAAYSAYNGGAGKICRWTNPKDAWARNDQGYAEKYDGLAWNAYVQNHSAPARIDASCLIEGGEVCPPGGATQQWVGKLMVLPGGVACALDNSKTMHCMAERRDAACLGNYASFDENAVVSVALNAVDKLKRVDHDRHACAASYSPPVNRVGNYVKAGKDIYIRATPAGSIVTVLSTGAKVQVLDFEVRGKSSQDRYYRVTYNGKTGYFYAGDKADYSSWAASIAAPAGSHLIPITGDRISIQAPSGINLRATPGGNLLTRVPRLTVLTIAGWETRNGSNDVYYRVSYGGHTGYIYAGQLLPNSTQKDWVIQK